MYLSKAMVIEGVSGVGAITSTLRFMSSASFLVVLPNTPIRVFPCSKSGKLWNKELIPVGLKNTKISYFTSRKSDKSAISVRKNTPCFQFSFRRSEEHTSELQSRENLVCRLLLEK